MAVYRLVPNSPILNTGADWVNFSSGYELLTSTFRNLGEITEVLCALPVP